MDADFSRICFGTMLGGIAPATPARSIDREAAEVTRAVDFGGVCAATASDRFPRLRRGAAEPERVDL